MVDTFVVGVVLALSLAAAAIATKGESIEALFGIFREGVGMLATFVAVDHECVHDGWPLGPAARGYTPVTDTSKHDRVAKTAILKEVWKKGIARHLYRGVDAC